MVKKIVLGIILFNSIVYANPIELDFSHFDNYKRTSDRIYKQARDDSRNFSYNRTADLSKLPEGYLQHLSQPALESLELQREILKHILEEHSDEIDRNKELQFEFVRRAIDWEENYNMWNAIKENI